MKAVDSHNDEIIETSLLRGKLTLLQPKVGYHASLDAVFLGAAAPVQDGWKVLDMGCGVGTIGLCVTLRNRNISLIGIDIQSELIDIALQNANINKVNDISRFFNLNILNDKTIVNNCFNSIIMNPPYQESGTVSPVKNKTFSHDEGASGATLKDWIKYAHLKLKQGGYLTMIHRADRLDDILLIMGQRRWFGSFVILPLHSREGDNAKRVIIRARKERYAPTVLKRGIVIHNKDGSYTATARGILDNLTPIDLD
jgi:tRNA1(Val) A37 N6-methylase TrmN6